MVDVNDLYVGEEGVITVFDDDRKLITVPTSAQMVWNMANGAFINGIERTLLYNSEELEVAVIDFRTQVYAREDEKQNYWSSVMQQNTFSEYLAKTSDFAKTMSNPGRIIQRTGMALEDLAYTIRTEPFTTVQKHKFHTETDEYFFRKEWNPNNDW